MFPLPNWGLVVIDSPFLSPACLTGDGVVDSRKLVTNTPNRLNAFI